MEGVVTVRRGRNMGYCWGEAAIPRADWLAIAAYPDKRAMERAHWSIGTELGVSLLLDGRG